MTLGNATLTNGDLTLSEGKVAITDTTAELAFSVTGANTSTSTAKFTCATVVADNKGVIEALATGNLAAGGCVVNIAYTTGTPDADARVLELLGSGKDLRGVFADVDGFTNDVYTFNGGGAIAAGKAILKVTGDGTPAAADSYLAFFDYSGMTSTNNPVAFKIKSKGTAAQLNLESIDTGAAGVTITTTHTSTGSAAVSDVVFALVCSGLDSGDAAQEYGAIKVKTTNVTHTTEASQLDFYCATAGVDTLFMSVAPSLVTIGNGAAAYLSSNGSQDLILETNGGTNSGTIAIADGVAGDVTITAGATSGEIVCASPVAMSSTETITAGTGGALSLAKSVSLLETDGPGDAYTLAAGVAGQIKFISMITDGGGDAVITLTGNPAAYDVITMGDVGDSALLVYTATGWMPISLQGCVIA
jgi:hypothetical protein